SERPPARFDRDVARHEAAHACVALHLGIFSDQVIVNADGGGVCKLDHKPGHEWSKVLSCIAGVLAAGDACPPSEADRAIINTSLKFLAQYNGLPAGCSTIGEAYAAAERETRDLVKKLAPHIAAVADRLATAGKLYGFEVEQIYDECQRV